MGEVAVMDIPFLGPLNWGYIQLGLVALVFGGLQVWWIGSTLRKRELARPLSEREFRKTLERIWSQKTSLTPSQQNIRTPSSPRREIHISWITPE